MADLVQLRLEDMVQELEVYEQKGLFSKLEIRSIVQKRTKFEYALQRRIAKKIDFLRSIEYEMNLDALRRKRQARMKINEDEDREGWALTKYAINRRIGHLLKRATNKFRGDVNLWLQYIKFAQDTGANQLLNGIFATAIQFHPSNAKLWVLAASWEYEKNVNIAAARTLMQRGLRMNPNDETLWHEYFRLELMYIEKIKLRRKVLGVDSKSLAENEEKMQVDGEENQDDMIKVPELTGEDMQNETVDKVSKETAEALDENMNPILQGLLAKIVYDNAIKAIPDSLPFRTAFVDIYRLFTDTEAGCEHVYETIQRDLGQRPSARAYLAQRHLFVKKTVEQGPTYISSSDPAFVNALKACMADFDDAIKALNQAGMWEEYLAFLQKCDTFVTEENLKRYLDRLTQRALKNCSKTMSESLYVTAINYYMSHDLKTKALDSAKKGVEAYPHSVKIWLLRLELLRDDEDRIDPKELYLKSLNKNPASKELWSAFCNWIQSRYDAKELNEPEADELYTSACNKVTRLLPSATADERNVVKDLVYSNYARWASEAGGAGRLRHAYKKVARNNYPGAAFFKTCIELEKTLGTDKDQKHVVSLFEQAISRSGPGDKPDLYSSYIAHCRSLNQFDKANEIYFRACKDGCQEDFDIQ
ncbi:U3 small nucleolar RNA-associated protein 6-domain-containing protein [Syncephalastrum racemosum]|uniref:U3 small nucleolar RNA-associated protein 6-domain-containing protein n=1 Tax=Syncephalastrum racemosum TaxID=13706 RepID=A0A1X2HV77_SYNRA|nr:U3 small nucleolar RNA-associated protein 6-domain-containing protein [Syncephalastrum racemosum]